MYQNTYLPQYQYQYQQRQDYMPAMQQPPQYVTIEEFKALKEEIERLKRPSRKGGVSNDPD